MQAFSSYLRAQDTEVQRSGFLKATGRALSGSDRDLHCITLQPPEGHKHELLIFDPCDLN